MDYEPLQKEFEKNARRKNKQSRLRMKMSGGSVRTLQTIIKKKGRKKAA